MKSTTPLFHRRYKEALRSHLLAVRGKKAHRTQLPWGREARAAGLGQGDLARLHESILITELLPSCPRRRHTELLRRAGEFFALAISPAPPSPPRGSGPAPSRSALRLGLSIAALSRHAVGHALSNRELARKVEQLTLKAGQLRESKRHVSRCLRESDLLKEQLRRLSRRLLVAQEEERKKVSRELHDVVSQALVGINIRLATLKQEASLNTRGLHRNISVTQKLVQRSAQIIHQFARDLRPAVLDDLGLVPALRSYLVSFGARAGLQTRLSAYHGFQHVDPTRRTVLFRVAQEALTNIIRYARASRVDIILRKSADGGFRMSVRDDGQAFNVERVLQARGGRRLGLLGARERLEMIGGRLHIESTPGKGTILTAHLPPPPARRRRPSGATP